MIGPELVIAVLNDLKLLLSIVGSLDIMNCHRRLQEEAIDALAVRDFNLRSSTN